jgi:hypothetical protein
MKINARTAIASVYINEEEDRIIIETFDSVEHQYIVKGGNDNLRPVFHRLYDALENCNAKAWQEARKELLVDVEF